MSWKNQLRNDSLPWLLESENPGVRYLALRHWFDLFPDDKKIENGIQVRVQRDGYKTEQVREDAGVVTLSK